MTTNNTQVRSARLYLDPESDVQGSGFWTGKFAPKGTKAKYNPDALDQGQVTAFQEKGEEAEAGRYYADVPEDEEETIKSLTSEEVFSLAKQALAAGNKQDYQFFKAELENRAYMKNVVGKAITRMAGSESANSPANKDKRVFQAVHGIDEETSTEDKEDISVDHPEAEGVEKAKLPAGFMQGINSALDAFESDTKPVMPQNAVAPAAIPVSQVKNRRGKYQPDYERKTKTGKEVRVHGHGQKQAEDRPPPKLHWKTLVNNGIILPPKYKARNVLIGSKPNAMAEEMLYRLVPYLKEDRALPPDAVFLKNFTDDLDTFAKLKCPPDLGALRRLAKNVIKLQADDKGREREAKAAERARRLRMDPKKLAALKREESLHKYVTRDGKEETTYGQFPALQSGIFMGATTHKAWYSPNRGRWVHAPTKKDIILNGSKFPADKGEYRDCVTRPNEEWVAKVHYRENTRKATSSHLLIEGKSDEKWDVARLWTAHERTINAGIHRDLSSSDPQTKELATAMAVMVALHIRNGGGDSDSTGVCDLTTRDVWLHKEKGVWYLHFDFKAKAGEREQHEHMGARPLTDSIVATLRGLGMSETRAKVGKPIFPGVDPEHINVWLQEETGADDLTAHKVRHHYASAYFKAEFEKLKKQGKPKDEKAAKAMLNAATREAGLRLGHAVQDATSGSTARDYYIDPKFLKEAMDWMGFDLRNTKEVKEKRFEVTLKKSMAGAVGDVFVVGDECPLPVWDDMIDTLFGDPDEVSKSDFFSLYVWADEKPVTYVLKAGPRLKKVSSGYYTLSHPSGNYEVSKRENGEWQVNREGHPPDDIFPKKHHAVAALHALVSKQSVKKAIGTKSSDRREKPIKRAKPTVTAKVTSTKNGKKNYDYRDKKPGADVTKKAPANTPPKGASPGPESESFTEVQPQRLADLIKVPVAQLQKIASQKTEEQFVSYLRSRGSTFMAKHKVPLSYLQELYAVLSRDAIKSIKRKGCKKCGSTTRDMRMGLCDRCAFPNGVKSFTVNPAKLKKGSEERRFAESLVVSGVTNLGKLATFLAKGYDLTAPQAKKAALELHSTLRSEGALR